MSAQLQPRWQCRAMTTRDVDTVLAIELAAYRFPWSRGNFIDSLAAGYIAEVLEGAGVGMVGYFLAMPGVDELHLLNVTVTPAWHGHGHGRALLDAVAARGRALGLATLWLEVRTSNQRARALYSRLGFAEIGTRRGYYPDQGRREDAVVMRLVLDGATADGGALHALD